jgi:CubicO group peptidase (beta-lactamase class C family)
LKQTIAHEAITVIQNKNALIPIRQLDETRFASLTIGKNSYNSFTSYLTKYGPFSHFQMGVLVDTVNFSASLARADVVVIALFANSISKNELATYINRLAAKKQVILCGFDNPQGLGYFENASAVIAAYADDAEIMQTTAQIIFGGLPSKGSLPIKVSDAFVNGSNIHTTQSNRFSYQRPEAAGLDSRVLEKIETIAKEAIDIGSTPGCYVQVVKDGKVIYDRGFGWLTYEKKSPVTDQTIYDLASVTKVTATLQTVMYMYERGMIDVHKKLSVYLPELKESNKADFTIKDILTHQAGLWPFLPFWAETVKDSLIAKKYYSRESSEDYPFPVAENMFASKVMKDSLWQWIINAKVRDKISRTPYDYKYSDMGFYMLQHLAEKLLGMPMEDFLQKNLYQPIGANTMGYLPLRKFPKEIVAPTEDDKLFRKRLLVGYVHDQGAAMHGGIAGHAGLFSNANDLAKMGQLWLNGGSYGGVQFLNDETLKAFTQKQYEGSRRGLGWDRPTISDWNGPTTLHASAKTFGHTGFTGTCVWVDPEVNLVYVFLANRVYPDMTNNKILNANIRPRIQEVIYQSIFEYCARKGK